MLAQLRSQKTKLKENLVQWLCIKWAHCTYLPAYLASCKKLTGYIHTYRQYHECSNLCSNYLNVIK